MKDFGGGVDVYDDDDDDDHGDGDDTLSDDRS